MADDPKTLNALAQQFLDRGEPEEALQLFGRVLQAEPENVEAWCGSGHASYAMGRLERADRSFRRAARFARVRLEAHGRRVRWWADEQTRPYLEALHGRGLCRFWMHRYEDAVRIFTKLLRLAPTDPFDVRFLLGEAYFRTGHLDRAIRAWQAVGDDPDALYNLGLGYFYRGEFTRSVNAFRRGIFENLFLVARLTDSDLFSDVPTYRGTHYKGLDHEDAAVDYLDRCGDLWRSRPLLRRWLRGIYEHDLVRSDVREHLEHLHTLTRSSLSPGDRAQVEGRNTALRDALRLERSDAEIAQQLCERMFRLR